MANTYTQIHIQAVFAVRNRESLIQYHWKVELYKYITGILQGEGHKMLQINGMPDHIHILFGFRPTQSLSDLMKVVKAKSSKWINEHKIPNAKFNWQSGYGAFIYSKSEVPSVLRYIMNQEIHHQSKTFQEEYKEFLKENDIIYDNNYLFDVIPY
jgi:REP element-mobilizing transposase RayT